MRLLIWIVAATIIVSIVTYSIIRVELAQQRQENKALMYEDLSRLPNVDTPAKWNK